MKKRIFRLTLPVMVLLSMTLPIRAQMNITREVIGSGGGVVLGDSNEVYHTAGQPFIGELTVSGLKHQVGFWYFTWYLYTGAGNEGAIPASFSLYQNYPNPFNPVTTIRFALPQDSHIDLRIYDVTGRLVATIAEGLMEAGMHEFPVKSAGLASGVYFYRLRASGFTDTKKMIILR